MKTMGNNLKGTHSIQSGSGIKKFLEKSSDGPLNLGSIAGSLEGLY